VRFSPGLVVFHPTVDSYYADGRDLARTYRYGAGRARVWRRHGLPLWYFAYEVARSFAGVVLSLLQARGAKAYWHWGGFPWETPRLVLRVTYNAYENTNVSPFKRLLVSTRGQRVVDPKLRHDRC